MDYDLETSQNVSCIKELFKQSKGNPEDMSKLIDEFLVPHENDKKTNAEVSTPYNLRQEMLDKIPEDFWTSPKKVFEPCSGKGGFLLDVINRFDTGLKILDDKERRRVILEECLYFAELNPVNIFINKLLIDPEVEYKLNFYQGNTLELNVKEKFGLEKFDLVVGNPPYNKNLYKKFSIYCMLISKMTLFVIPSTFTIGVSHIKFINQLKENGIKIVNFIDKSVWKTKIDIETLYFLSHKGYNNDLIINDIQVSRIEKIYNLDKFYHQILTKINSHEKLTLLKGTNKTLNHHKPIETEHIKFKKTEQYNKSILSRLNGGRKEEHYYTDVNGEISKGFNVLFPRGTASYNSISNLKKVDKSIVYSKIIEGDEMLSTGIVYINCSTFEEAEFIQWYMMRSKLVRLLFMKENKFSELTRGFVNIIPKPNIKDNNIMTDKYIYNYFNLNKEEISYLENNLIQF